MKIKEFDIITCIFFIIAEIVAGFIIPVFFLVAVINIILLIVQIAQKKKEYNEIYGPSRYNSQRYDYYTTNNNYDIQNEFDNSEYLISTWKVLNSWEEYFEIKYKVKLPNEFPTSEITSKQEYFNSFNLIRLHLKNITNKSDHEIFCWYFYIVKNYTIHILNYGTEDDKKLLDFIVETEIAPIILKISDDIAWYVNLKNEAIENESININNKPHEYLTKKQGN